MKKMIKAASWLMAVSLIGSFMLIPAKPVIAATVYKYEWVSQSGTVSPDGKAHQYTGLKAGDSIPLSLTLINRSGITIVGKSALPTTPGYQVPIGTWGIGSQTPKQDGTPYFLDSSSFILNNNRFVYYDWADVPNGGYFTMNWTVKLANGLTDGVYDLYYRPVCEYLAWTRQYKNGRTLLGTNSDIFTRFVVGSGISGIYLTYTNQQYGFSFDYPQPIPPAQLKVYTDYANIGPDILMASGLAMGAIYDEVLVWRDSNLNNVIAKVKFKCPGFSVSSSTVNDITWTVLKGQIGTGLDVEERVGGLPNGYNIELISNGPDYRFLNSFRSTDNIAYKTYTNSVFGFSLQYPANYTVKDNLPKTWVNETRADQPLEISSSEPQKPGLQMYVNPGGWGPIWQDITYMISPQQGKIIVTERTVVPESNEEGEYNNDGRILITTQSDGEKSFGKNDYWFGFSFKEGAKDYESVFQQILASFRYTV